MKRKAVGFFASLMSSSAYRCYPPATLRCAYLSFIVPVARAADDAKPGTGVVSLSESDPCLVIGHGTSFLKEFTPNMQIMLPKSVGAAVAEVVQVISDTELRIKREFGGESGKGTARIHEKVKELQAQGKQGLDFKKLPHIDQNEMYQYVYECLKSGGSIGIFPEGIFLCFDSVASAKEIILQVAVTTVRTCSR